MEKLFSIADYSKDNEGHFIVKGRAYKDIFRNQKLQYGKIIFNVLSISSYGHEISELSQMMTGQLVLEAISSFEVEIKTGDFLYMAD